MIISASLSFFFFSSRRRHTRCSRDWSSDVCSSDLYAAVLGPALGGRVGCDGLGVAVCLDSETIVREVCRSLPLQPVPYRLSAPHRQIHVTVVRAHVVGVSIQSDKQCAGNGQVVLDLIHLAFAFWGE